MVPFYTFVLSCENSIFPPVLKYADNIFFYIYFSSLWHELSSGANLRCVAASTQKLLKFFVTNSTRTDNSIIEFVKSTEGVNPSHY